MTPALPDGTAPPLAAGNSGPGADAGVGADVRPTVHPAPVDAAPNPTDLGSATVPPTSVAPPPTAGRDRVIRAKDIKVGLLRARLLVARGVRTRASEVARLNERRDDKSWERERSDTDITAAELIADVIYAKDVRAVRIRPRRSGSNRSSSSLADASTMVSAG